MGEDIRSGGVGHTKQVIIVTLVEFFLVHLTYLQSENILACMNDSTTLTLTLTSDARCCVECIWTCAICAKPHCLFLHQIIVNKFLRASSCLNLAPSSSNSEICCPISSHPSTHHCHGGILFLSLSWATSFIDLYILWILSPALWDELNWIIM